MSLIRVMQSGVVIYWIHSAVTYCIEICGI